MTDPNVRRLDRGYVRDVPGELTSGGHHVAIHLADRDDTSSAFAGPETLAACSWCYLHANHSTNAHLAATATA